jgi:hypothetical protein
MGRIIVETTIENMLDPSHTLRCDALVDTGAAYLTLPTAWRDRLGALTALATVDVETADQSTIQGVICGPVLLRMERFRPVLAGSAVHRYESRGRRLRTVDRLHPSAASASGGRFGRPSTRLVTRVDLKGCRIGVNRHGRLRMCATR